MRLRDLLWAGFLVMVVTQFLGKPVLHTLSLPGRFYGLSLNMLSAITGVTISFLAWGPSVHSLAKGLVAGWLSVYGYEIIKNTSTVLGDSIGGDKVEGDSLTISNIYGDFSIN